MKYCICNNINEEQIKRSIDSGLTYEQFLSIYRKTGCRTCDKIIEEKFKIKTFTKI